MSTLKIVYFIKKSNFYLLVFASKLAIGKIGYGVSLYHRKDIFEKACSEIIDGRNQHVGKNTFYRNNGIYHSLEPYSI